MRLESHPYEDQKKLPFRIKFAYAAPAFSLAVIGIPIYVYIPKFYTDVVGVNIGILGTLILLVRVFDAVTDPVIGFISDRTRTIFGRRRPYIASFSVLLAFSVYLLFNPPDGSRFFETAWFGIWFFLIFLFWTLVTVPYESLGPELTFDYNERTTLFGLRDGALIAGTLMAASSPAIVTLVFDLNADAQGEKDKFFWISVFYAPFIVLFAWWCVWVVKERKHEQTNQPSGIVKNLKLTVKNKPFLVLLASYTVAAFGSNLPATLILYYVEYVLESKLADLFLLLYFVTGIVLLPIWVYLAKKFGKKNSWITAMIINTGAFIGVFFLGPGDEMLYGILVVLSGLGFGATIAIPSSMQADVIDYDELLSGERHEGQYVGIWSISKKLAAALGVGIALSFLSFSGYEPNVEQSEEVKLVLRTLYALVPSICNLAAMAIAFRYPIDGSGHKAILKAINDHKSGRSVIDPFKLK
ncbi:MAG: glycoside-pentoside-hexuronide (GPH):cation symporter [Proteobacteria bacterium]|nr:glycoside-pentoside-hexuronide (GPH):cation symporter [Pseudomonadota bacterium]